MNKVFFIFISLRKTRANINREDFSSYEYITPEKTNASVPPHIIYSIPSWEV